MGQIVFNGQKPKYCNLTSIQPNGNHYTDVPKAGEIWLIDSTNSLKPDGTGKYDKYIVGDNTHTAGELAGNSETLMLIDTGIDDVVRTLEESDSVTPAEFDPQSDTVWHKQQTLSAAQKSQARENINAQEKLTSGTNIKTVNNESILGTGNINLEQGNIPVVFVSGTTLSAVVNKVYTYNSPVTSLAITLPAVTDVTKANALSIFLTTGISPTITFTTPDGVGILYHYDYNIKDNMMYEFNVMFNGNVWVIGYCILETI